MPPDLWERVCAFVGTQTVPSYQSPTDFVRDAIVHRLQYWKLNSIGEWRTGWTVVFSGIKASERAEYVRMLRELPGNHRESLQLAFDEGLYDVVQLGIEHLREVAPNLPNPIEGELIKMASDFEDMLSEMQALAQAAGLRAVT